MHSPPALDCLVIGAGPAGLTAALYLRRYQRRVLVVDHGHSRALAIERTHNYPGFPQGIAGHELLQRLREQLADVQGEVVMAEVTALQHLPPAGFAASGAGLSWRSRTVLMATGVVDIEPELPGVEQLQQHGLLRQCPICDGYEHRGQRIVVLGDGTHAAREAAFIAHYSPKVVHIGLHEAPTGAPRGARASPTLATGLALAPGGGVRVQLADGSAQDFDVAYAAAGVRPRAQLARALGAEVNAQGSLVSDGEGATNVPGVFAAGDVAEGLDQLVVAASQGAVAATAIHNLLRAPDP